MPLTQSDILCSSLTLSNFLVKQNNFCHYAPPLMDIHQIFTLTIIKNIYFLIYIFKSFNYIRFKTSMYSYRSSSIEFDCPSFTQSLSHSVTQPLTQSDVMCSSLTFSNFLVKQNTFCHIAPALMEIFQFILSLFTHYH